MPRKKTYEEYVRDVALTNSNIEVMETYQGNKTRIKHRCKIDGCIWSAKPNTILSGEGCPQCGGHKQRTHEDYVYALGLINCNIEVLEQYINANTKIWHRCKICGYKWKQMPNNFLKGNGCPGCSGRVPVIGKTDLWTTHPHVAKLLQNSEDGYKHSYGSSYKTNFICPNCGNIILKSIYTVCCYGLSCSRCSDNVSYPNKFGRAFLEQLPIVNLICEYAPTWAKPYKYDNYFEYNNKLYILEMDGGFHYDVHTCSSKSLEERQHIDQIKTELATQHNIYVIRIDCQRSELSYIKDKILMSDLKSLFDLSNIDWASCDTCAQNNMVKEACSLYMNVTKDLNQIKDMLHLSIVTARRYLNRGVQLGWCDYNFAFATQQAAEKRTFQYCLVDNQEYVLKTFRGIKSIIQYIKNQYNITMNTGNISIACKTHRPYKGFNFRHIDDTQQNELK